jgi:hypothetical protein
MIAALARWMREEARLLGLSSWASDYHGPPDPLPCTARDPRCARLAERQDAIYRAMRRAKAHLLDRETVTSAAATDVRHTIAQALAVNAAPVRLVKRRAR